MPTVWFIRHTESEGNAGLPTAYPETIQLTPKGIEQAQQIALSLKERQPPGLIITSPYVRTLQTAQPTLALFPTVRHEQWDVQEFTYLSPAGAFTTASERRPLVEAFWKRLDPKHVDGEDAESFVMFIHRVQHVLKKLRQSKEEFILVFSHEQFIGSIAWLMLKGMVNTEAIICSACMKSFRYFLDSFRMPNGSIMPMQLQDDNETWISNVMTSHLLEPHSSF